MATNLDHPLLVERQACILQASQIDKQARREGRDNTAEESAEIDTLLAKAEQLHAQWEDQPQPRQTSHRVGPVESAFGSPTIPTSFGSSGGSVASQLFGTPTETRGFSSFGDFLECVDGGRYDTRLVASNKTGVDSEGGFLVPQVFANAFIDAVVENTVLASRVRRFPMTSDTLHISGFDGNDHSSTLFGGIMAAWEEELGTLTEQAPTTRRVSFNARKLAVLTQASNELVSDASAYERMLGNALVQATAWKLDYALLRGTGAGQPLGCVNSDSKIEVAKESSQTPDTIWYANVVKMFARLHPMCYKSAIWVINPTCITELMQMDMHASAGSDSLVGDNQYIPFRESDGKFTLFGRPVEVTEKLPTLGDAGDIILVDPQCYALAMRQEIVVEKSAHAGFASDSSYYRAKMRCDGRPLWGKVMTPNTGDTLSWCVTLAERA